MFMDSVEITTKCLPEATKNSKSLQKFQELRASKNLHAAVPSSYPELPALRRSPSESAHALSCGVSKILIIQKMELSGLWPTFFCSDDVIDFVSPSVIIQKLHVDFPETVWLRSYACTFWGFGIMNPERMTSYFQMLANCKVA